MVVEGTLHPSRFTERAPFENSCPTAYRVRVADRFDLAACFRLRFEVFNLELNEGLDSAFKTGYDIDEFDSICDHIVVEHLASREIVGTYRLQTGRVAKHNLGYYSDREFNLQPYEPLRNCLVEVGRACIHRNHRSVYVLYLLWRGIAQYALQCRARYLIGCSSLTSQDAADGLAVYDLLREYLAEEKWLTLPRPAFELPAGAGNQPSQNVPKLLRTYLAVGAKICGPPAIDKEFKTIDFLTLLDLETLHPRMKARFFDPA